jgi:flagellar biosynthesis/type III secretory pathway chaperone
MIALTPAIRDMLKELNAVLDEEIALLSLRRSQMKLLSGAILDRDDDAVERLLGEIERMGQLQAQADARLGKLRSGLAELFGCQVDQMRLSRLIESLAGADRQAIEQRRRQIAQLAGELQRQHLETAVVVFECARINRLLLECLYPAGSSVNTYGAGGAGAWRGEAGLVDTEL